MAFTDEQFDARLSPMFRSMRPAGQPRSVLNGLLTDGNSVVNSQNSADMVEGPRAADYQMPNPSAATPSRAQMMMRPARTEYAKSTPATQPPQQVWQSPSVGNLQYPESIASMPRQGIASTLIDGAPSVAAGLGGEPMPAVPSAPLTQVIYQGGRESIVPPEAEVLFPQGGALPVRPPDYLAPVAYQPLQPSRRYEVI